MQHAHYRSQDIFLLWFPPSRRVQSVKEERENVCVCSHRITDLLHVWIRQCHLRAWFVLDSGVNKLLRGPIPPRESPSTQPDGQGLTRFLCMRACPTWPNTSRHRQDIDVSFIFKDYRLIEVILALLCRGLQQFRR